jgi:mannose-6-phosphate isomerase-like protein (cupin superfamily)
MRRRWLRITTTAAVVTVALSAGSGPLLAAHETAPPASTTPPAEPITVTELAPGVTAEVFASAPSDRAPDQTVYLARFVFQGGAEIFPHSHPGTVVLGVESGSFGWTLLEGTAHVVRGAAAGSTGPVEDVTEPGTEVILEVGDAIYYEDDVTHTARSASDEPAVVFGTLVLTTGEPLLMPADMDMSSTAP